MAAAATTTGAAATVPTTTTSCRSRSRPPRCAITCNGQLALLNLPLRDRQIVTALIDALDDDGYLPTPLEEIAELFPAELEIEPEELTIALKYRAELRAGRRRRARSAPNAWRCS